MEEKLIEYTDKIIEAIEAGVDFAGEQAPLLIQEILSYYAFYHGVLFTVFTLMVLFCWGVSAWIAKEDGLKEGIFAIPLGISFFPMIGVIANSVWLYKIIYAPRFFLIEELSRLL